MVNPKDTSIFLQKPAKHGLTRKTRKKPTFFLYFYFFIFIYFCIFKFFFKTVFASDNVNYCGFCGFPPFIAGFCGLFEVSFGFTIFMVRSFLLCIFICIFIFFFKKEGKTNIYNI